MPRSRVRKELLSHLLEYEYFIEKASSFIIVLTLIILIIVIPNWTVSLTDYETSPTPTSLHEVGISMFITVLLLMAGLTAFLVPHFEPVFRPHGFRALKDKRMLNLYLALINGLLAVSVLVYLIYGLLTNTG